MHAVALFGLFRYLVKCQKYSAPARSPQSGIDMQLVSRIAWKTKWTAGYAAEGIFISAQWPGGNSTRHCRERGMCPFPRTDVLAAKESPMPCNWPCTSEPKRDLLSLWHPNSGTVFWSPTYIYRASDLRFQHAFQTLFSSSRQEFHDEGCFGRISWASRAVNFAKGQ